MEKCDRCIVCPGNLNDCLQVHQDVDDLVSADSKELCNSRCRKWYCEKGDSRDNIEEMGKMLGERQCLRIKSIEAGVHVEGQAKAVHGCCWVVACRVRSHNEFEHG